MEQPRTSRARMEQPGKNRLRHNMLQCWGRRAAASTRDLCSDRSLCKPVSLGWPRTRAPARDCVSPVQARMTKRLVAAKPACAGTSSTPVPQPFWLNRRGCSRLASTQSTCFPWFQAQNRSWSRLSTSPHLAIRVQAQRAPLKPCLVCQLTQASALSARAPALSLSSSQSGQHLLISAHVGEPSSLSGHAVSVDSGESAGKRECFDASWPAGTAQHIIAASKVGNVRCNELRSSGGSVGSCRTSSDLSNSQHDSYQGSYPSRPESSGTQGTLDHLSRWQISVIH